MANTETAEPSSPAELGVKSEWLEHASAEVNRKLSPEDKIRLYREMVRIRKFEQAALQAYQRGKMGGFLHLYIGQEATAVGTVSLMGEHDHVITAYRDHGHALAVGMNMNECMAELFGKVTGCSQGKGGSMHFFAPEKHYWGGHGIVGGQTPLGLGLAYALKYKGLPGCCLCFMGDGAVNQGTVHESFNLASLWDVPVVYVIENNRYSMGTSQSRSSAHPPVGLAARAEAYAMDWELIDGSNLYEIRAKAHAAMERARQDCRPSLLEIATYRYYGHSIADANHKKYRTKEEIEEYQRNKDPITVWERILTHEGHLSPELVKQIDKEARDEAQASVQFADESPFPQPTDLLKHVYSAVDDPESSTNEGTLFFNDRLPWENAKE